MTDKDKLRILYNYIKLIEPNERVNLADYKVYVSDFGSAYLEIWCKNNKFTAQSNDLNPNWLHKIFRVYRVSIDKVRDAIPSDAIVISCNRFYVLYPRNEELFKDD